MACLAWHERGLRNVLVPRPKHLVLWVEPEDMDALRALVTDVEAWFASDEAQGWYTYGWIDELRLGHFHSENRNWRFSDPNTAFAFKMRFV